MSKPNRKLPSEIKVGDFIVVKRCLQVKGIEVHNLAVDTPIEYKEYTFKLTGGVEVKGIDDYIETYD